jgi:hypothetical protein
VSIRQQADIHSWQSYPKVVFVEFSGTTTTRTLKVNEQIVRVTTGSSASTLTLPNVQEAMGKMYAIQLMTDGGGNLTVNDGAEAEGTLSDTYADAADRAVYFSDGQYWHTLASTGTA